MPGRLATLALFAAALAACLPGLWEPGYPSNMHDVKVWARLFALDGVTAAYDGPSPHYANIPPIFLYALWVVGLTYRELVDPSFGLAAALDSQVLTSAIKAVPVTFHLLTGAVLLAATRRIAGERWALAVAAAYLLNPAAIYEAAYWGQIDTIHGFLVVSSFALLMRGRAGMAAALFVLAILAKPYAGVVLPVLAVGIIRLGKPALARAFVGSLLAAGVALAPFLISGRGDQLVALAPRMAGTQPVISAEADNIWLLVTQRLGVDPYAPADSILAFGVSYRTAGLALALLAAGLATWWAIRTETSKLPLPAAALYLAWFLVTTQAHTNWSFLTIPLLAMVLAVGRWVWIAYVVVSSALLASLVVHDPLRTDLLHRFGSSEAWWWVAQAIALATIAGLVLLVAAAARSQGTESERLAVEGVG